MLMLFLLFLEIQAQPLYKLLDAWFVLFEREY